MNYLEAGFIILGTMLAWPLISGAVQGVCSYFIARLFPLEKLNVSYTDSNGEIIKRTIYVNNLDEFFEELKTSGEVPSAKEK